MRKSLIIVLCLLLVVCLIPTYSMAYAKTIKAKSVSLDVKEVTLVQNGVIVLHAQKKPAKSNEKLVWSSSNKKVAKVTKKGVVTGVAPGNAVITVKTKKSKKNAKCKVKVEKYMTESSMPANLTREDVLSLIKSNTVSEDGILKMIQANTVSKDDILKMIRENAGTTSEGSSDWVDGTKLKQYSGQTLPMELNFQDNGSSGTIRITDIEISKYHNDVSKGGNAIKYVVLIKGELPDNYHEDYIYFNLSLCQDNLVGGSVSATVSPLYFFQPTEYSVSGNKFTIKSEISNNSNMSTFLLNSVSGRVE